MPRPATAQEESVQDLAVFQPVNTQVLRLTVPILRARAVYTGNNDHKSVALPGQVSRTRRGDRTTTTLTDVGLATYDFARYDSMGDLIESRLMGKEYPADVQGRPYQPIEHAEHLRLLMRMKDDNKQAEFSIRVHPEDQAAFANYVQRKERALGAHDRQVAEAVA